jgi:hypothetical protein
MTNYQSVLFSPVLVHDDKKQKETIRLLVKAICSESPSWAVIDLNLMDPESLEFSLLVESLRDAGMIVNTYCYDTMLYERFDDRGYDEYLATRPKVIRKNYPRLARNLEKKGDVRFHVISDNSELDWGIENYNRVLANSWKEPELFPNHTAGLIRGSACVGALRLGLLFYNNDPVATQLWLVAGGIASAYKSHYDLRLTRESVGSISMLRMFKHVLDIDHVKEINFGVGTDHYKRNWLTSERPICGILACNPRTVMGLKTLSSHVLKRIYQWIRSLLKPVVRPLLPFIKKWSK